MNNESNKNSTISFNPVSEKISQAFRLRDSMGEDECDEEIAYDRDSHFEELCSCVPDAHVLVGELEYEIPHSPGLTWEIHSIYFVGPAEREGMNWLLYRIDWDDNWGCYRVEFLAECKGHDSPKLAAVEMLESLFNNWLEGEGESHPGWRFLAEVRENSA